jgi:DNA-directed RNA polymerase specialized sigma24 family protein
VVATAVARIDREQVRGQSGSNENSLSTTEQKTFQALVMQALQLRRVYREAFILCDIKGYTVAETAAMLCISEDAVIQRLHRARVQMKRDGQSSALK